MWGPSKEMVEVSWIFFFSPSDGSGRMAISCLGKIEPWEIEGIRNIITCMVKTMQIFNLLKEVSGIPIGEQWNCGVVDKL